MCEGIEDQMMEHIQRAKSNLALTEWRVRVKEQQTREVGRARSQRTWNIYLEVGGNSLRAK